jgi:hypothetical protein
MNPSRVRELLDDDDLARLHVAALNDLNASRAARFCSGAGIGSGQITALAGNWPDDDPSNRPWRCGDCGGWGYRRVNGARVCARCGGE